MSLYELHAHSVASTLSMGQERCGSGATLSFVRALVPADDSAVSTKEDQGLIFELLDTAYAFSRQDGSKKSDADDALWQQVGLTLGAKASATMQAVSVRGDC